jgi:hypothetical protein
VAVAHFGLVRRSMPRRALTLLLLLWCGGCITPKEKLRDASTLSDSELRQLLIGHWYANAFVDRGEPLLNWIEADYRSDGSCTYTYMVRRVDPRTNNLVTGRADEGYGRWEVSSGKLIEHWERNSFPLAASVQAVNTKRISIARILRASTDEFDVSTEPFNSLEDYHRHLTIIPINP